jgi:hypothetical protein
MNWINVNEQKPNDREVVVCWIQKENEAYPMTARWTNEDPHSFLVTGWMLDEEREDGKITHWARIQAPLPNAHKS